MPIVDTMATALPSKHTAWSTAVTALSGGRSIVLIAADRAALMFGAGTADTAQMAALIRHSSGFVQTALPGAVCDRLLLPEAASLWRRRGAAANGQCIAVDAAVGVTTGISATDRARTARALSDPRTVPGDLSRPGHMVPVRVASTSAETTISAIPTLALALTTAACTVPGAVYADLVSPADPIRMASAEEATEFAVAHNLVSFDSRP